MSESVDLATVDEKAIKDLIDEDPRKLSQKDLRRIVNYMRVNREHWLTAEKEAGSTGTHTKKPKLDLNSLDLEIEVEL